MKNIFNWYEEKILFGNSVYVFNISVEGVELNFILRYTNDVDKADKVFEINVCKDLIKKTQNSIDIYEEIINTYLISTDDEFRKKFKRSYNLIKFETQNNIITIGMYNDTPFKPTSNNSYLLCTTDFINILAKTTLVNEKQCLMGTQFEELSCLFDQKDLARILLK